MKFGIEDKRPFHICWTCSSRFCVCFFSSSLLLFNLKQKQKQNEAKTSGLIVFARYPLVALPFRHAIRRCYSVSLPTYKIERKRYRYPRRFYSGKTQTHCILILYIYIMYGTFERMCDEGARRKSDCVIDNKKRLSQRGETNSMEMVD